MSSHTLDKLIYMANQIAIAFRGQEGDNAAEAAYDHIWHYWDPRMRAMIRDHATSGGAGLNPIAAEAIRLLTISTGKPRSATHATEFSQARDPDLMSDAG